MRRLSRLLNEFNLKFWTRVIQNTNLNFESLSVFRIIAGLFLLCIYFVDFTWIGEVPDYFFRPPVISFANFFDEFPDRLFFLFLDFLILLCLIFVTIGLYAKYAGLTYVFLSLIGFSFQYSFGKIDHNFNLCLALVFCMSFAGWGCDLAVIPDRRPRENSFKYIALLSVLICFAFFTAGILKAYHWLNVDFGKNGTGSWFYRSYFNNLRQDLLANFVLKNFPFWSFKVMDYLAVFFELSPIAFLLHSRKAWKIWLTTACAFHFGNVLMFNISNFISLAVVYLSFLDFSFLYFEVKKVLKIQFIRFMIFLGLGGIVFFRSYCLIRKIHSTILFIPNDATLSYLYAVLVIWCFIISIFVYSFFVNRKPSNNFQIPLN